MGVVMSGYGHDDIIDAINKLLNDKVLMKSLAKKGQKYALQNFSIERWVSATEDAYLDVIKNEK